MLRNLANVGVRLLLITFERSCLFIEISEDGKNMYVTPVFMKDKQEELWSCQPVSHNTLLEKLTKNGLEKWKVR